jgi:serine/threonine protein kinase
MGVSVKTIAHDIEVLEPLESPPGLEIHLARQVSLNRLVEVVALKEGVTPRSPHAAAAITEARAHSRLHHRSIIEVYSFELTDSTVVIEREAAQGPRLSDRLEDLTQSQRLGALREIALALAHAHERRVLHGNLTPNQVVLAAQGGLKLGGFGVELEPDVDTCPSDAISGAGLRVPEVRLGAPYGVLAEIYGFGCLACEVLTGTTGEEGSKKFAVAAQLEGLALPPHVLETLTSCLSPIPAQRPASMDFVAERLDPAFLERRPRPSRSVPRPFRLGAFASSLLALGFVGLGALSAYLAFSRGSTAVPHLSVVPMEADRASDGARIRVVARPWAHVSVDGKFFDTTPFATPISVEPGVHTVRLEHPAAAPEERTVQVGAGQTALIDVALKLTRPIILDREAERPIETTP